MEIEFWMGIKTYWVSLPLLHIVLHTDLYEVDTPLIGSGSKATHVPDDPSAKSNEGAVAV